jgi:mannose-1-phosphate guanylyltransferase
MPADHDIRPASEFERTIRAACESVEKHGGLMVFGIKPTYAATGYGYIHRGERMHEAGGIPVRKVLGFREKPDAATAAQFVASGDYLWNSGIFVWKAADILAAIRAHEPKIGEGLAAYGRALAASGGALADSNNTSGAEQALAKAYATIPAVSIDVGVLERARDVRLIEIGYGWSDVGSWDALDELLQPDGNGHRIVGPEGAHTSSVGSARCLVHSSEEHVIALVGVEDLIVVHTRDATLICKRGRAEDVKKVVEQLAREKRDRLL